MLAKISARNLRLSLSLSKSKGIYIPPPSHAMPSKFTPTSESGFKEKEARSSGERNPFCNPPPSLCAKLICKTGRVLFLSRLRCCFLKERGERKCCEVLYFNPGDMSMKQASAFLLRGPGLVMSWRDATRMVKIFGGYCEFLPSFIDQSPLMLQNWDFFNEGG